MVNLSKLNILSIFLCFKLNSDCGRNQRRPDQRRNFFHFLQIFKKFPSSTFGMFSLIFRNYDIRGSIKRVKCYELLKYNFSLLYFNEWKRPSVCVWLGCVLVMGECASVCLSLARVGCGSEVDAAFFVSFFYLIRSNSRFLVYSTTRILFIKTIQTTNRITIVLYSSE